MTTITIMPTKHMFHRYVKNYGDDNGDIEVIKYGSYKWHRSYDPTLILPISPLQKEGEPPLPTTIEGWQMGVTREQIWLYVKDIVNKPTFFIL